MRLVIITSAVLAVALVGSASAQPPSPQASASPAVAERGGGEWDEYISRTDGFRVNFPGQPKVAETTYKSEYGADLPARVYSVDRGRERYAITVVDYGQAQRILTEKAKACPDWADERCKGVEVIGLGYWKMDIAGALLYATYKYLQRDAKLTHMSWNFVDLVEAHLIQMTNNADGSRTFACISMHENKLYILDGTVPKGYPEPGLFQQSMGYVDKDGNGIRYRATYSNIFLAPARTRGGPGGGPAEGAPAKGNGPGTAR